MPKSGPYTDAQLTEMRTAIQAATSDDPITGNDLDVLCFTNDGSRSAIVKKLRAQGDPVIGRDWRRPMGYFWGVEPVDCEEQAHSFMQKAASFIAGDRLFREHAARLRYHARHPSTPKGQAPVGTHP